MSSVHRDAQGSRLASGDRVSAEACTAPGQGRAICDASRQFAAHNEPENQRNRRGAAAVGHSGGYGSKFGHRLLATGDDLFHRLSPAGHVPATRPQAVPNHADSGPRK
uniref:(northern house mosquito) hypothetical protein n=1 Tax=Culex pipiens TaxID=7175 RepID=A0A8D8GA59_CULPI